MPISIQTNTNLTTTSTQDPTNSSRTAQIMAKIQQLTERLGKIPFENGMTTEQKKEMAELIQKQIESLKAELEQLQNKQNEIKSQKNLVETLAPSDNKQKQHISNNIVDTYV